MNSRSHISTYNDILTASNAERILSEYDIVLDCTDNAPARYLLSDACVKLGLPLVSGAAQRLDGQLCTYNLPPLESSSVASKSESTEERGPCYRCLFPKPPAPEMAGSCEETGILGAVTGVIGSLQALEAIKIITSLHGMVYASSFCHISHWPVPQTGSQHYSFIRHLAFLSSDISN